MTPAPNPDPARSRRAGAARHRCCGIRFPDAAAWHGQNDVRAAENQLLNFIAEQERAGRAPSYIKNYVTTWKSWLSHHGVRDTRPFNLRDPTASPTLADECVPTRDELRAILSNASPRGCVVTALMAFTGVRPEVLGNLRGTDGLRIGDIPDLRIDEDGVTFDVVPAQIIVRKELSKARNRYFTFLGAEGCDYLKAYSTWATSCLRW